VLKGLAESESGSSRDRQELYETLAQLQDDLGRHDEATDALVRAIELKPASDRSAQQHVIDAVLAESVPHLRRRVAFAQWALALEHELVARVFGKARAPRVRCKHCRSKLMKWFQNQDGSKPTLRQMANCLEQPSCSCEHQIVAWTKANVSWLVDADVLEHLGRASDARNKANHPEALNDSEADRASQNAQELLCDLCAGRAPS
jgi:hypothetical protein